MSAKEQARINVTKRIEFANELLTCMDHKRAWRHAFAKYPKQILEQDGYVEDKDYRKTAVAKARLRLALYNEQGREDVVALILKEYPELAVAIDLTDN